MSKIITDSGTLFQRRVKPLIQRVKYPAGPQACGFIFGAQRSGTTLLSALYNNRPFVRVLGEFNHLGIPSKDVHKSIRMRSFDEVNAGLEKIHAPMVIMKPLVESQHAKTLLEPEGRSAVWMYRHYAEVASSNVKKFGSLTGAGDLRPFYEGNRDNWRSEGISKSVARVLRGFDPLSLTSEESACLFWYARNALFFEQPEIHPKTLVVSYDSLIDSSSLTFSHIMRHHLKWRKGTLDLDVGLAGGEFIMSRSERPPRPELKVRSEIVELCEDMLQQLNAFALST
jgi:hypothetical protein